MDKVLTTLLLATLALSCQRSNITGEHGHSHSGESRIVAYTLYTDKTELFIEFRPLVVDQLTTFAAHFTRLGETFLPVDEGSVTVSLIVGDRGIRQTTGQPASPGIFRLALKPVTAGTGRLVFDLRTGTYTDRIVIDSVMVFPDQASADRGPLPPDPEGGVSFLKEQAWKIEFATREIQPRLFHQVIRAAGELSARPSDEQVVSAKASGFVRWGDNVVTGRPVKQGQRLFVVASGNITEGNVEAQYREAKVNFERAEADLKRVQPLLEDKIISQKDYVEIRNRYDQARIQFDIVGRNYTQGGQAITSPMTGFIKQLSVRTGEYVQAGQPLAVVTTDLSLQLLAEVPVRFSAQLPFITEANFKRLHHDSTYNTSALNGKVVSYGKALAGSSSLLPIYFSLINDGTLIPGEPVEVFLKSRPIDNAFVVPESALLEEQGNHYVYVQVAGETFEKRQVTVGGTDGTSTQIVSGLKRGERVVTKGARMIRLATESGSVPAHGHEH